MSRLSNSKFFSEVLGAKLRNVQWSWGAVDEDRNRVFLRVWEHGLEPDDNSGLEIATVFSESWASRSPGFSERRGHLELVRSGKSAYAVRCVARDPNSDGKKSIKSYDDEAVYRLGDLDQRGSTWYAPIVERVPVDSFLDDAALSDDTGQLAKDLQEIESSTVPKTTKEALIQARIGQGAFRKRVLGIWREQCAVTGSKTREAIRASHIKPWSKSTPNEQLNEYNGLPLVANLDALFDAGLISFKDSGESLVSPQLSQREREILRVSQLTLSRKVDGRSAEFLEFHRKFVFRKSGL